VTVSTALRRAHVLCRHATLREWIRHHGVYAIGRPDLTPYGEGWAAYLATRGRGRTAHVRALGGRSALATIGVCAPPRLPLVVVENAEIAVPGVITVRTRELPREDLLVDPAGLCCTAWPRALLDIAPRSSVAELEDALARLADRGLLDLDVIDARLDDAGRGRHGVAKLRRALEPYRGLTPGEHRSLLERLADHALSAAGLPRPEINGPVVLPNGRTVFVDLLMREQRIAIEVDGRAFHERIAAFESDRVRDRQLQRLGFNVPRFTWWEVKRRPQVLVSDVGALLRRQVPRCARERSG
jgi:hypothetical protein